LKKSKEFEYIFLEISYAHHISASARNDFLDLFFCLSIPKSISMGAANVLEMFDPPA